MPMHDRRYSTDLATECREQHFDDIHKLPSVNDTDTHLYYIWNWLLLQQTDNATRLITECSHRRSPHDAKHG